MSQFALHGCAKLPAPGERDIRDAVARAKDRIKAAVNAGAAFVAFSGGKDSIVTAALARRVGIREAACDVSLNMAVDTADFKAAAHSLGLEVHYYEPLDEAWLHAHPEFVFMDPSLLGAYYAKRQQATIRRHWQRDKAKAVIVGRRTEENTVRGPLAVLKSGMAQYFPIFDWTAADVWQFIVDAGLPVPRIYTTRLGMADGATSWPEINVAGSRRNGFDPLPFIDRREPGLLERFAADSELIRDYLKGRG